MTAMDPAVLALPFRGTWRAEMSPARRVPSHGTHQFAATYAIELIQARRARGGAGVLAGNHVVRHRDDGGYVALAHLRAGSIRVAAGASLTADFPRGSG